MTNILRLDRYQQDRLMMVAAGDASLMPMAVDYIRRTVVPDARGKLSVEEKAKLLLALRRKNAESRWITNGFGSGFAHVKSARKRFWTYAVLCEYTGLSVPTIRQHESAFIAQIPGMELHMSEYRKRPFHRDGFEKVTQALNLLEAAMRNAKSDSQRENIRKAISIVAECIKQPAEFDKSMQIIERARREGPDDSDEQIAVTFTSGEI